MEWCQDAERSEKVTVKFATEQLPLTSIYRAYAHVVESVQHEVSQSSLDSAAPSNMHPRRMIENGHDPNL
jgi:hypothetical protein